MWLVGSVLKLSFLGLWPWLQQSGIINTFIYFTDIFLIENYYQELDKIDTPPCLYGKYVAAGGETPANSLRTYSKGGHESFQLTLSKKCISKY